MKLLFSTGSLFYLPLKEIFSYAKEAGFDGCDVIIDRRFNNHRYMDSLMESNEILPVYSIHAPFQRMEEWGTQAQALMRTIHIGKELGAQVVNFHPPSWFSLEVSFLQWFKKIKDFQKELNCENLVLTIENMPLSGKTLLLAPYVLNNYEDLIAFGIERNLYFTFDITHLATFGNDIVVAFLKYFQTRRLKNIHVSDYRDFKSHLFLGRGDLPIVKLLNTIRRLGYDEMVTLELGPQELPRTKKWLKKLMAFEVSFLKIHLTQDGNG